MKRIIIIFSIILTIIIGVIIVNNLNFKGSDNVIKPNKTIKNNFYTMLLETDVGSGEYIKSTSDEWPSEDYVLNKKLSGCKNGSELSFDEENKIVYVSAVSNDSCYVYFSKGVLFADYIKDLYTTDGVNNLYLHDGVGTYGDLEAGDNSYRYSGANPNNYVCFGTDTNHCPVDNLYRIIGVFGDNVKLIKYDYATEEQLGTDGDYIQTSRTPDGNYKGILTIMPEYGWNTINYNNTYNATGYYNVWKYSLLNTINLNTNFINYLGDWSDKIAMSTWYNGGIANNIALSSSANIVYDYELGNNRITTSPFEAINTKVGIIYMSEYFYGSSPDNWNSNLNNSNTENFRNNNWLFMGFYEWVLSRDSSSISGTYYIDSTGKLIAYNTTNEGNTAYRPTFYLNDNVTYVSGDGSNDNPYRIN